MNETEHAHVAPADPTVRAGEKYAICIVGECPAWIAWKDRHQPNAAWNTVDPLPSRAKPRPKQKAAEGDGIDASINAMRKIASLYRDSGVTARAAIRSILDDMRRGAADAETLNETLDACAVMAEPDFEFVEWKLGKIDAEAKP